MKAEEFNKELNEIAKILRGVGYRHHAPGTEIEHAEEVFYKKVDEWVGKCARNKYRGDLQAQQFAQEAVPEIVAALMRSIENDEIPNALQAGKSESEASEHSEEARKAENLAGYIFIAMQRQVAKLQCRAWKTPRSLNERVGHGEGETQRGGLIPGYEAQPIDNIIAKETAASLTSERIRLGNSVPGQIGISADTVDELEMAVDRLVSGSEIQASLVTAYLFGPAETDYIATAAESSPMINPEKRNSLYVAKCKGMDKLVKGLEREGDDELLNAIARIEAERVRRGNIHNRPQKNSSCAAHSRG